MRNLFFLILCFFLFLTGNVTALEDTSRLIRRAYLDLIERVPTTEEMDWYLVYNPDNSYDLAIKYLYDHPRNKWKNASFQEFNRLLNSSEYKKDKRQLSKEEIEYIIFYVSGDYLKNNSLPKNKKVIISNCLICGDSDIDKIDYISFNLMSRPSTVDECNILLDILKSNNTKSETDKWLMILDKIMTFEDFITK